MFDLLNIISKKEITLMKILNDFFTISPKGKYKYFTAYSFDIQRIRDFIHF